jgi:subtilisin family serine protease
MPIDARMRDQINLILDRLPGAEAHPDRSRWDDPDVDDVDYLYRVQTILARDQDATRVADAVTAFLDREGHRELSEDDQRRFGPDRVAGTRRVVTFTLPDTEISVPTILDTLDRELGRGVATPDHILYVCPEACPATEPMEVPPGTVDPVPPPGLNARGGRPGRGVYRPECDGDGVFLSIVDTGLMPDAAVGHPWLVGVNGTEEKPYALDSNGNPVVDSNGNPMIVPYAGHGTFVAGVARCMAPKASAYVERAFDIAGANYETMLPASLADALDRNPDILVFTFCTSTRLDQSLITFDDFFDTRIRFMKGLLVVAPAGNDGQERPMWPAAYREVLSVGALSANWRDRAYFSNYGKWVDVYAPGQDLINAFPAGTYVCIEPPVGQHREFQGMAKWNGTSFSTPVVAGLVAARMSATGENAQQAADSLLRLACRQTIPGVGAVLYPGQACDDGDDECSGRCGCCGGSGCGHAQRTRCGCGGDRPRGY